MVMNTGSLSVIVPMYNEEKNIVSLLARLEQQSLRKFEVIVVDDGSSDSSATLVKNYKPVNYELKLLHQNNQGAAKAREYGIRESGGEFIAVVDCDDDLSFYSLENTLSHFLDNNVDISLFELYYVNSVGGAVGHKFECFTDCDTITGISAFENCIANWGIHAFGIYRRNIILSAYDKYHQLNVEDINYLNNDEIISRISLLLAKKIHLKGGAYFFVNNGESTTRRVNRNYYKVISNSFLLFRFIEQQDIINNKTKIINSSFTLIASTLWGVFIRYLQWNKKLEKKDLCTWQIYIKEALHAFSDIRKKINSQMRLKSYIQLIIIRTALALSKS